MKKQNLIWSAMVMFLAAGPVSYAAPLIFFGEDLQPNASSSVILTSFPNAKAARTQFLSNLTGVTTQDFESFAVGTAAPLTVSFGSDTATITSANGVIETGNSPAPAGPPEYTFGRFATSGNNYLDTNTNTTITFSTPQAAFGFYATDIGDQGGLLTLTLANGTNDVLNVPANTNTAVTNGSVLYYGVIEPAGSAFTAVTFGDSTSADAFGFDDLTIGRTANVTLPEPTSVAALAVAGAVTVGRRRRLLQR